MASHLAEGCCDNCKIQPDFSHGFEFHNWAGHLSVCTDRDCRGRTPLRVYRQTHTGQHEHTPRSVQTDTHCMDRTPLGLYRQIHTVWAGRPSVCTDRQTLYGQDAPQAVQTDTLRGQDAPWAVQTDTRCAGSMPHGLYRQTCTGRTPLGLYRDTHTVWAARSSGCTDRHTAWAGRPSVCTERHTLYGQHAPRSVQTDTYRQDSPWSVQTDRHTLYGQDASQAVQRDTLYTLYRQTHTVWAARPSVCADPEMRDPAHGGWGKCKPRTRLQAARKSQVLCFFH
uniref:Uncharacterized protein n=1 Tax=Chrysemys picta bellii TaxID=8478 RepID=A0A8C3FVG2_CHRPI